MKRTRKAVAIILVMLAIISMSACGSKPAEEISGIDSEPNTELQLQATEPNTTMATEEKYLILKSNGFTDSGVAWVECCDKMGYPYLALINTEGEILYKHENGGSIESYENVESGMGMIDDGQYNFINDKGEIIKTFEKSEFTDLLAVGGGQALFYKKEDGINGFKHNIAVLGNDGNWTLDFRELNVDDFYTAYSDYVGCNMFKMCIYSYFDNYDNRDWLILNGKTGGITYIENSLGEIRFENDVAYFTDDISDKFNYTSIYSKEDKSDMLTLQDTCAVLNVDGNYRATGFSMKASYIEDGYFTGDSYCVVDKSTCSWRYANCKTNEGAFIENYEVDRVKNITDIGSSYLVEIKGKDSNMYFTVMDINGKESFEPIKYDSVEYREDFILYSAPDEDSLIAMDYSGNEIKRFDYDSIGTFNCGLAVAEKSTESGDTLVVFINSEGEEIIPDLYE